MRDRGTSPPRAGAWGRGGYFQGDEPSQLLKKKEIKKGRSARLVI
jgi:hypothetical protein